MYKTMAIFVLVACSPTSKSILKKYKEYSHVTLSHNRLGIQFFDQHTSAPTFFFANTSDYIGQPKENYLDVRENMKNILSERFVVLDAKNPAKPIDFKVVAGHGVPKYSDREAKPELNDVSAYKSMESISFYSITPE